MSFRYRYSKSGEVLWNLGISVIGSGNMCCLITIIPVYSPCRSVILFNINWNANRLNGLTTFFLNICLFTKEVVDLNLRYSYFCSFKIDNLFFYSSIWLVPSVYLKKATMVTNAAMVISNIRTPFFLLTELSFSLAKWYYLVLACPTYSRLWTCYPLLMLS